MTCLELHLPVRCTLVIVYPDNLPKSYSDLVPMEQTRLMSVRFETVKLWEIDPDRVLRADRPNLISVLPLLRTSREQMVEERSVSAKQDQTDRNSRRPRRRH